MDSTTLDPADLPGYVGEVFDFYLDHPEMLRLVAWGRLEPIDGASTPELHHFEDPTDPDVIARRRAAAVLAAERLFPPRAS